MTFPRSLLALPFLAALLGACNPVAATGPDASAPDAAADGSAAPCSTACEQVRARCGAASADACLAVCARAQSDAGADRPHAGALAACVTAHADVCEDASWCWRNPLLAGPYGTRVRDLAEAFTLETSEGPWSLADHWTGHDSYVFLVKPNNAFYNSLVTDGGTVADVIAKSPRNVHYFFLQYRHASGLEAFRSTSMDALSGLTAEDQAWWRPRIHFVAADTATMENWIGTMVRARRTAASQAGVYDFGSPFQFAIDRTQRLREVGQLGRLASGGLEPDLSYLAHEATYYDYEWDREARLREQTATTIRLLDHQVVHDTTYPTVTLPGPSQMAGFDTMEVVLTMECPDHRDGACGAWDYISDLRLCETPPPVGMDGGTGADASTGTDAGTTDAAPMPPRCTTEIARWITSYWRETRWVTDISGMLAFLQDGGPRTFRWYASGQWDPRATDYIVSLDLRLSNRGKGMRPVAARLAYEGGALNGTYNTNHPPFTFQVPAGTRKTELYALVTGHGADTRQCAEFCNHTHHFALNGGTDRTLAFPEAQTLEGCAARVSEGVVPNQHGTWYFGRGGWCPGLDVRPWTQDLTTEARVGADNTLTYRALIGTTVPASTSYGNIDLSAYVIFWR